MMVEDPSIPVDARGICAVSGEWIVEPVLPDVLVVQDRPADQTINIECN